MTADQKLEYPFWRQLALAVIGQAAKDYVYATMMMNGERIIQSALTYDVRANPERMQQDCETFFFGGWFRILSGESSLDGMEMATMIETDYREMYENMRMTGNGKTYVGIEDMESKKERERRRAREKYRRKVAARKKAMAEAQ